MNRIKASQIVKPKISKKNILEIHEWNGVPERSMIQKIYQVLVLRKGVYEGNFCRKYMYKTQLPMDKNFEKAKISAVRSKNDGDVIVTITGFERKDVIFKVVDEGDGDAQGQSHGEHGKGGGKDKCDGEGVANVGYFSYYRKSATSERSKIVKDLNNPLTHMDYVNSRIEMVGLILFGPEKARSTLRSVRAPERIVDDLKCFKSMLESFEKHCCVLPELGLRHMRAFTNICNYVAEKAAIKEALIVSCAMTKTKKYGIDVRNPSVEATPAPLLRSQDNYCARIFVNGTSRKKLESYARPYRVLLAVSQEVHQMLHYMAEKDASRGGYANVEMIMEITSQNGTMEFIYVTI
ncbi:asparaginyl endopeptidase 1 [Tanacetum coccineum]